MDKKSDPNEELFKRFHEDLIILAEGIDWTETMNFITKYHGPAARAIDVLANNKTEALKAGSYYPKWSAEGPTVFADPYTQGPFHRPYNAKTALSTANFFDYTMKELDERPGNKVYDWRLGIPPFLQMISWRIQYIAAMYPNFRTTGERDFELEDYRFELQSHYKRMLSGVRCGRYRPNTGSNAINPNN